jgi:hypothetical protein
MAALMAVNESRGGRPTVPGRNVAKKMRGEAMMTIEELLTKEEIKELRICYSHHFDGKDIDALVDLFTDDAVCEFGPAFGGDWVGKDQIRRNLVVTGSAKIRFAGTSQHTRSRKDRRSACCTLSPTPGSG